MVQQLRDLGVRGALGQATHFHARERRRETLDPALGLQSTNKFPPNTTLEAQAFAVGAPVTLATTVRITGASPNGLVWEIGDGTHGAACWIEAGAISAVFGGLLAADSSLLVHSLTLSSGQLFRITAAAIPGDAGNGSPGIAALWVNGTEIPKAKVAAGTGYTLDQWTVATPAGSVGQGPNGTVNTQVPVGARVAPSDFEVVAPLDHYRNQVPRQFIA